MQTDVTSFAVLATRFRKANVSWSSIRSTWPGPPGTHMMSMGGHSANVVVGTIAKFESDKTVHDFSK